MQNFSVSENFRGGCILVDKIDGDNVYLKINNRDSQPWFCWAFKVENAQGKKLNFFIQQPQIQGMGVVPPVGYFGPAVSHDLVTWDWLYQQNPVLDKNELNCFSYQFSDNENCVYFSHHFLYDLHHFDFDSESGVIRQELCKDVDKTPCSMITFGDGDKVILLTARHHSCESSASYMLHGVVQYLIKNPIKDYKVICVPFVDVRGVVNGDQGKGRLPHDHNRDYTDQPIYPTVKALKSLIEQNPIRYAVDFHDPMSAGDDRMRLVNHGRWIQQEQRLSELYSSLCVDGAFKHQKGAITYLGFTNGMFSTYVASFKSVRYATTIEAPYFGTPENAMTVESYLKTGNAFAKALTQLIKEID